MTVTQSFIVKCLMGSHSCSGPTVGLVFFSEKYFRESDYTLGNRSGVRKYCKNVNLNGPFQLKCPTRKPFEKLIFLLLKIKNLQHRIILVQSISKTTHLQEREFFVLHKVGSRFNQMRKSENKIKKFADRRTFLSI